MKFHEIRVTSVSACFELENTAPYCAQEAYDVTLDGAPALKGVRTNVFSLFDLRPDTQYTVAIGEDAVSFRTKGESGAFNVRDFGAKGDGQADDTTAIQTAILICPEGGRVIVPPGTYRIRPVVLTSNLTLELKEGAVLLGDTEEEHYPLLPGETPDAENGKPWQIGTWEGEPSPMRQALLSAWNAKDVTIVGRGVIDGNAQNSTWWQNVKQRKVGRPRLVFLNGSRDIVFHGITGRNSPSWNFHPFFSQNVEFLDIAVEAPKVSPNTDGIDPESCDYVKCIGVRFSVGDDAIAIKSGKIYMGMKYQKACSHLTIRNCLMEYAHGAVVLGSEMSGGIRDLAVSQCLFSHTDRGLRIKTRRGRGKYAVVDGVEFSNIRMENVLAPLVINMYYNCDPLDGKTEFVWSKEPHPVDDTTPHLGKFVFRDMECVDCEWAAGYCYGLPEQPVDSVTVENVRFTFREDASSGYPAMMDHVEQERRRGLYFHFVKKVVLKNVTMEGQDGEEVTAVKVGEVVRE